MQKQSTKPPKIRPPEGQSPWARVARRWLTRLEERRIEHSQSPGASLPGRLVTNGRRVAESCAASALLGPLAGIDWTDALRRLNAEAPQFWRVPELGRAARICLSKRNFVMKHGQHGSAQHFWVS
jgi:hypothetical protein